MEELAFVLVLIVVGFVFGQIAERRHFKDLDRREAALERFPVVDLARLPGLDAASATVVYGEVVVATDYFKTFLAGLRNIVGGEVGSYQKLLDRARREARLRMLEQARQLGASAVVNVRYEMNDIGGQRATNTEIFCFGTALIERRPVAIDVPTWPSAVR